jgi:hypothetical protein
MGGFRLFCFCAKTGLMRSVLVLALLMVPSVALAQGQPEAEWGTFPPDGSKPTAPTEPSPPPVVTPAPVSATPPIITSPVVVRRARAPELPNVISMAGAPTLGHLTRGESISLGFPLISLRFAIGLGDRFDLGAGFDSYYVVMNEPMLTARLGIVRGESWSFSAVLDAGYSFFTVRANREAKGARWLTGRRNINVSPGVVVSYQGSHPRSARLFFELRYLLALDTEPFSSDPLGGVPPSIVPGHNGSLRGGAELPLSSKTSFLFMLGLGVHGRQDDSPVMPEVSVGLVTSF